VLESKSPGSHLSITPRPANDLDRARKFYGELLGCPEGRKMPGRADFNFFGHHIVAHLAPVCRLF
jgi:extradiol dioxygenase family protein